MSSVSAPKTGTPVKLNIDGLKQERPQNLRKFAIENAQKLSQASRTESPTKHSFSQIKAN